MTGRVYPSATGDELVMRALYGRHCAVAERVPADGSVLELCPGPGALYAHHLHRRSGAYTGIDGAGGHQQCFDEGLLDDLMTRYAENDDRGVHDRGGSREDIRARCACAVITGASAPGPAARLSMA